MTQLNFTICLFTFIDVRNMFGFSSFILFCVFSMFKGVNVCLIFSANAFVHRFLRFMKVGILVILVVTFILKTEHSTLHPLMI